VAAAKVLAAATLWAVNGVVARGLFQRAVDPGHLVQVRMVVGGLALLGVAVARGTGHVPRAALPMVGVYAVTLAAVQLTYFEAIASTGVATAIFLQYTSPLVVAAWESARARRLPPPALLSAMAMASVGSALLVLPARSGAVSVAGLAWGLSSSLAMAAATLVAVDLRRRGVRSIPLLAYGLVLGSLMFVPIRWPWTALATIPPADVPYFLYVAILATAVPFTLYASALARLSGSVAMLLAMLEPVLAAALAWIALGESLSPAQLAGGVFILAAIAVAARRGG
jgi:drug/metabolite transporter (DMT)-like permease